jgi:hypothetical protein
MANRAHALPDDRCAEHRASAARALSEQRLGRRAALQYTLHISHRTRRARMRPSRTRGAMHPRPTAADLGSRDRPGRLQRIQAMRTARAASRRGRNGAGWVSRHARFVAAARRSSAQQQPFALRHVIGAVGGHIGGAGIHARAGSACARARRSRAPAAPCARAGGGALVQADCSASRRCAPPGPRRYGAKMALDGVAAR